MPHPPSTLLATLSDRLHASLHVESDRHAHRIRCRAMSTPVNITFATRSPAAAQTFRLAALDFLIRFEARYSRFCPDSIVGQINAAAGTGQWLDLDDDADRLFTLCSEMHALTAGVFDPAALPLLRIWDWKATPPRIPADPDIRAALDLCGWSKVDRRPSAIRLPAPGMGLDLGGIGKELAVDHLLTLARSFDIHDAMIDIGQDLRVAGRAPGKDAWYIGLEEPDDPGHCWTALRLTDHAVATSGDYSRSFTLDNQRYGHILDPRTGHPVRNPCQSVSVIAPTCTLAGILATTAFILGPDQGLDLIRQHPTAQACITTTTARHQTRKFASHVPV